VKLAKDLDVSSLGDNVVILGTTTSAKTKNGRNQERLQK